PPDGETPLWLSVARRAGLRLDERRVVVPPPRCAGRARVGGGLRGAADGVRRGRRARAPVLLGRRRRGVVSPRGWGAKRRRDALLRERRRARHRVLPRRRLARRL